MYGVLSPCEIEVGKQYQVESKYYFCALVTVLENESGENKEKKHGEDWVGWKVRVDESFGGVSPLKENDELSLGWDTRYSHYSSTAFKPVGSSPEYNGFTIPY